MPETFKLVMLTPDKNFLTADVTEVIFETPDGRLGVMAGHMPIVASVAEGTVEILLDGVWKTAAISQGFANIDGKKAEFFVDTVEWSDEIDAARAREALQRAEIRMKSDLDRVEYARTRAAMARALARLKAAEGDK